MLKEPPNRTDRPMRSRLFPLVPRLRRKAAVIRMQSTADRGVQHGAFVVVFFDQDAVLPDRRRQDAGACLKIAVRRRFVSFYQVLDFQISEENSGNYQNTA